MLSRTRGYLPHLLSPEGIYFVTFRLANSLPAELLCNWKQELDLSKKGVYEEKRLKIFDDAYYQKIQNYLDQSYGNCWLRRPDVASIIDGTIRRFNKLRYELFVWTIMPNHVHAMFL